MRKSHRRVQHFIERVALCLGYFDPIPFISTHGNNSINTVWKKNRLRDFFLLFGGIVSGNHFSHIYNDILNTRFAAKSAFWLRKKLQFLTLGPVFHTSKPFSGRGEIPHRRYVLRDEPASAFHIWKGSADPVRCRGRRYSPDDREHETVTAHRVCRAFSLQP